MPKRALPDATLNFILRRMDELRLSQSEVAKRAGLSRSTLSHLLSGDRGTQLQTLERIADALGVSVATLMEPPRLQASEKKLPEIDFVAASTTPGTDRLTIPPEAYEQLRALIQKIIDDAAAQKGYGVNTLPPHPTERRPSS